jgi:hypothetical protein
MNVDDAPVRPSAEGAKKAKEIFIGALKQDVTEDSLVSSVRLSVLS